MNVYDAPFCFRMTRFYDFLSENHAASMRPGLNNLPYSTDLVPNTLTIGSPAGCA